MTKPGKWVGYTLYLLVVAGLCLYVLFPSETVRSHLAARIDRLLHPYRIEIGRVRPAFPPALQLQRITLQLHQRELLQLASLRIMPDYTALFSSGRTVKAQAAFGDGRLHSRLFFTDSGDQRPNMINATLSDVALEDMAELLRLSGRDLSGRLSGQVDWDASRAKAPIAAELTVTAGRIELRAPLLALHSVDFSRIDLAFTLNRQRVLIKRCTLSGKQISGNLDGSIQLRNPLRESLLILSGVFKLQPDFTRQLQAKLPQGLIPAENENGGYRIHFGGTLDKPMFSLK